MNRHRYGEIDYVRRLTSPSKARQLGGYLLGLPRLAGLDGKPWENRFNHTLAIEPLDKKTSTREVLAGISTDIFADNEEGARLLFAIGGAALRRMRGLRPAGLPSGMQPWYLTIAVNRYNGNETFPTHVDSGKPSDVVAATLLGEQATFTHAAGAERARMPEAEDIISTFELSPGRAAVIRNHPTAREGYNNYRLPQHAVQNGPDPRLTLQVEVAFD